MTVEDKGRLIGVRSGRPFSLHNILMGCNDPIRVGGCVFRNIDCIGYGHNTLGKIHRPLIDKVL